MQRLPLTRNATRQTAKMQAHFPHQILPFRSEPEPAKYWLHFQTLPRIQVPRRLSVAVLSGFPAQNRAMHRWKKRRHLSALKPDRQSQYRKEQLQNPVKHIQFSPENACAIRLVPSPQYRPFHARKRNTASGIDTKPILLYGFSSTFPINCFTFCKSTANSRPVRPNKIPKRIRYVTVFVSVNDRVCERRTENFSSPSACEVADAVKDAIAAGSNAEYAILPLTTTSIAKRLLQTESERGLQIRPPFPQSIISCRCPGSGICGQTHGKVWHRSARQRPRAPHFRQTDV